MSIDFSSMDGYEFEKYILSLFRQLEFEVEATNYSNDGGIDLIATYNEPIFSGKYIIQCKNWTGSVGQPEVRDLFGVVMDQRANKGILITPSDFTQQAYDFAHGKNIELINGIILKDLISKKVIVENVEDEKPKNYIFRNNRYSYFQERIAEEPSNPSNYLNMIRYLREHVINQDDAMCTMELFDDIISWTDRMINKCFKTASKLSEKNSASLIKIEAYIHSGRLAEATELLLKIGKFRIQYLHGSDFQDCVRCNDRIITWNLLAAYRQIGYEKGTTLITTTLLDSEENWFKKNYYDTGLLGKMFFYPIPRMLSFGNKKTREFDIRTFKKNEIRDPTFFYHKFYLKSQKEYADEIDIVFKLHGLTD